MRIVFLGTPDYAIPSLQAIHNSHHDIALVITQPDRPSGRGQQLKAPAVKLYCTQHNISLRQTAKIKDDNTLIEEIRNLQPDLLITAAFGQILNQEIIDIAKHGIWNVHASLLPQWRGASPIQHAILHNNPQTGITIMQTDIGIDTGDIISIESLDILPSDTSESLYTKLSELGGKLLIRTINEYQQSPWEFTKQDSTQTTYAPKLTKANTAINWQDHNIQYIECASRAFTPYPLISFEYNTQIIKIQGAYIYNTTVNNNYKPGQIIGLNPDNKREVLIQAKDGILAIQNVKPPNKSLIVAGVWYHNITR